MPVKQDFVCAHYYCVTVRRTVVYVPFQYPYYGYRIYVDIMTEEKLFRMLTGTSLIGQVRSYSKNRVDGIMGGH